MTEDTTVPVCEVCEASFDPETVYATFKVDFRKRAGFTYDGKRPRWIPRFCSERCRYIEERARTKANLDRHSARRSRDRAAGRGDP